MRARVIVVKSAKQAVDAAVMDRLLTPAGSGKRTFTEMAKKCIMSQLDAEPYAFVPSVLPDQIGWFAYTGRQTPRYDFAKYYFYATGEFEVQHEGVPDNAGAMEYRERVIPQEVATFREILAYCAEAAQARDKSAVDIVSKQGLEGSKGLPSGLGDKIKSYLGGRRRKTRRRRTSKTVRMKKGEYLREHHHLFKVLAHPTRRTLRAELREQREELKQRGLK